MPSPPSPVTAAVPSARLGCCYYPEHWPEAMWADDARRMVDMGLTRVRIGEFAWSRIEPVRDQFDWGWLDRALDTLGGAGLGVILCTPTATPPKWLMDAMPDMLASDRHGRPRGFGSRRHYCFSHIGYRDEAMRMTRALAERYAAHPALAMWQTDNEYGCHDTTYSYSMAARDGFRLWLARRYATIDALNVAWGNVFWSMEYRDFAAVDLPNLTVTEPNPAHVLDFRRYSSDQVVAFNRLQVDILKAAAPHVPVTHNVMGFVTDFDHVALGHDLDVVTWDSYPLGFLEQLPFSESEKRAYARQGHPDIAAFHHDLYRGCGNGRWGVMEQQPGPVNWASHNPAPLDGMVRLWTLEAAAHGAELISYFRWRQAPFGQEQMHAGLHRPDNSETAACDEVRGAGTDLSSLGPLTTARATVAIVIDYPGQWVTQIQPQGMTVPDAFATAFRYYSAARSLGLDIDIVSPDADLAEYAVVIVPCLPIVDTSFALSLQGLASQIIIGARTAAKTADFAIPPTLGLEAIRDVFAGAVVRVESLRPDCPVVGNGWQIESWLETIDTASAAEFIAENGMVAVYRQGAVRYVTGIPDDRLATKLIANAALDAQLETSSLPIGIRTRSSREYRFVFNYGADAVSIEDIGFNERRIKGEGVLPPAGVAIYRLGPTP